VVSSSAFISMTCAFSPGQNIDSIGFKYQNLETKWFRKEKSPEESGLFF
jgi:hypothetical protein